MTEVHQVIIHVQLPTATREARLAYGFYTVTDGVVTMTDRLGNPATDETGKTYTQKLETGDDARLIAGRLTKKLRLALLGKSEAPAGFRSAIKYPKIGIA